MKKFKAEFKDIDGELVGSVYSEDITLYFESVAEIIEQLAKMNGVDVKEVIQDIYSVIITRRKNS